ncbi:two-component system sensor histidine kinase KdpD [Paenibacillus anaericanus]|uniref:universal stress protein n=1 Tax=Paenibacillus anaericanus TaxID=170367 RepID=UPI00278AB2A6|nr:universal stress protein [Paenibacillus anaericanus]MDQ0088088.1 two-component system sensor histidine kinase KdpD [Paenibacillus anaericanus]
METYRRKTPEELLLSMYELHRGRLKIFIGPVSGAGKTYQMLREGQMLKSQGIDVVICAVSTNQSPETRDQLGDLERIPSIHWYKDDIEKKDLDVEAIVKRNPEVVLTDGLAHRNQEGAERPGRLEDINYLLSCGISVITTVNVYELEGAADLARKWTGMEVEYSISTDVLALADELVLIDVTPEKILQRLSEGHLGQRDHTPLFNKGNLSKLRELALRMVAEDVNYSLEKHREEQGLLGTAGIAEKVLVSAQYYWNGSIHIRRGQQIAKRLNGELAVVSFWKQGLPLSKDAATFKRSLWKLADKIGASMEEIPFRYKREIPRLLVQYALQHNITRIVMGHSKQNKWQEFWRGSIANSLLKHIRNVDVFFVADRAEQEGERVLPALHNRNKRESDSYHRLSSQEVMKEIENIRRGTFKVYIGAAPGVGKTYKMLREGNDLLKRGIDVVVGLLETHGRKETLEQIGGLETVERQRIDYRGTVLEEMDTAAIIRRNPEVVLVDELAHTNMPGSKHKKRYMDVMELLDAGISVISTVNVQHLESLNDAVEQITGVRIRETVPDSILQRADEVELIDVTPKALQERMKEGKIYAMVKVDQALGHFFKIGNLIALRELALREIADDVDERLEAWERNGSLRGPWRRQEVIYVCITLGHNAERLIRRGFRIAYRLKANWYVTYVQEIKQSGEVTDKHICELKELTERLGGIFKVIPNVIPGRVASLLLERSQELQSTQIIIGQSQRSWLRKWFRGDVTKQILRSARHVDVLVVADFMREEQ